MYVPDSHALASNASRMHVSLSAQLSPAFRVSRVVAAVAPPARARVRFIAPLARRGELWWWEFESEIKRRLALEILMRRMFAMVV
jgi:hypothetical protein